MMTFSYINVPDSELLSLLRGGNKAVYEEIYNRYNRLLYIHAYRMLQDSEASKDVVQELFATLWMKREQISVERSLSSYLYMSVRNKVLDRIARSKVENRYIESLETFSENESCVTDHRVREKELTYLIEKEISALPSKMRLVFELSRKEYLSHKEIADHLQISEKTVKKQINNALKVLRVRLGEFIFLAFFSHWL